MTLTTINMITLSTAIERRWWSVFDICMQTFLGVESWWRPSDGRSLSVVIKVVAEAEIAVAKGTWLRKCKSPE